jgi:predicted metal-dependent hydrolase
MNTSSIIFNHSRRARKLRLTINQSGEVKVTIPRFVHQRTVDRFIVEHTEWIEKRLKKVEIQNLKHPTPTYQTGDTFYYLGVPLTLTIRPSGRKRPTVKSSGDQMIITLHHDIDKSKGKTQIKKALQDFFKEKATGIIHDRLQHWNEHYQLHYSKVTFRNQKTRWGSCSAKGNLNFNWRLAMAPIQVIDYVVVHELCHLQHLNHSKKFWALVEQTQPTHKQWRKWLRQKAYLLQI